MTKQEKDKLNKFKRSSKTTGLIQILQKDPKFAQSQAFKDVFQHQSLPNITEKISI